MKKLLVISFWLLVLGFTTWYCTKDDFSTSDIIAEEAMGPEGVDFIPSAGLLDMEGKHYLLSVAYKETAGKVEASKDKENVYIHFTTEPGWVMTASYLQPGTPPQFEYMTEPDPLSFLYWIEHEGKGAKEFTFTIPVEDLEHLDPVPGGDAFDVAFAAVAELTYVPAEGARQGTAWAGDRLFKGSKHARYFAMKVEHSQTGMVEVCEVELKTYSRADWGAEPEGQAPVSYLYSGFNKLFGPGARFGPGYLKIGCPGHFKEFITPEMVTAYLGIRPYADIGEKRPFPIFRADDFAGAVATLSLNVYFDWGFPNFAPSDYRLKDMIIVNTRTKFDGWTVREVLRAANEVLGECNYAYTVKEMNALVNQINSNYRQGASHGPFLNCPVYAEAELESIKSPEE